jgi:DNA-binding CsgD family transcriptional regulator
VLKRTRNGIACNDDCQTRNLREAIATCAEANPEHSDSVIFLSGDPADSSAPKVPLTMCRFTFHGMPTSLVTLMLPSPPDSRRIQILARELGLTQAEARVAALLQLGLSNREAAESAGLTEQTMNTYTKRVLHKFNVNSRAEIAQLLTWQGKGGLL